MYNLRIYNFLNSQICFEHFLVVKNIKGEAKSFFGQDLWNSN